MAKLEIRLMGRFAVVSETGPIELKDRPAQLLAYLALTGGRAIPRTRAADALWGTDATMAYARDDGWVWAFVAVDHYTAEAWATVARRGDRFAATEPICRCHPPAVRGDRS
jgi:hypothetical protein